METLKGLVKFKIMFSEAPKPTAKTDKEFLFTPMLEPNHKQVILPWYCYYWWVTAEYQRQLSSRCRLRKCC